MNNPVTSVRVSNAKCGTIYSYSLGCKTSELGEDYAGGVAKTVSGKECQPWAAQSPHRYVCSCHCCTLLSIVSDSNYFAWFQEGHLV